MKKIMFDDRHGLTKAVLEGRKTMTRRIVPGKLIRAIEGGVPGFAVMESKYKVGEVVAVAEAYQDSLSPLDWINRLIYQDEPGWKNKMFVRAELMPHQIRITNVRIERLQDISDEDCRKEGVEWFYGGFYVGYNHVTGSRIILPGNKYPEAFASLIDNVSGKGTWLFNPYVFVYEFELVK